MAEHHHQKWDPPPQMVALSPFKPTPISNVNPRRLSATFTRPKPNPARTTNAPCLAWVSLQGRLVGADEATSARAIGGGLTPHQALCWELFTPIHRVLVVAVVAVAVANSEKNRQISKLKDCVHLRDQILSSMQQKLDDLCEQVNCVKDQTLVESYTPATKVADCSSDSLSTDCWLCDQHRAQMIDLSVNHNTKAASGDEVLRRRLSISNEAEQEERRISDFSDWASSVTSAADLQLNNLAIEQDMYNLKKECDEKDAAIKELSAFIRSKDTAASKRIEELEDIIRRKNTIITKLRKDMIVLEQKVMNLTRARRRSYPGPITETKQLPAMTNNVLYDMDSSTSPSSSDSDCSSKKNEYIAKTEEVVRTSLDKSMRTQKPSSIENSSASKLSARILKSRPVSPLKEKSMNEFQTSIGSPRSVEIFASASTRGSRRRSQNSFKEMGTQKGWV